jgi:hypothetical protein
MHGVQAAWAAMHLWALPALHDPVKTMVVGVDLLTTGGKTCNWVAFTASTNAFFTRYFSRLRPEAAFVANDMEIGETMRQIGKGDGRWGWNRDLRNI